jgi:hypothetical protein
MRGSKEEEEASNQVTVSHKQVKGKKRKREDVM